MGDPPINGAVPEPGAQPVRPADAIEVLDGLCAAHGARLLVDLAAGAHPGVEAALRRGRAAPGRAPPGDGRGARPGEPRRRRRRRRGARRPAAGRRGRAGDVGALRRLEQECFGLAAAVTERFLPERALDDPDYRTVVAEAVVADGAGARAGPRPDPPILAKAHGHLRNGALGITGVATDHQRTPARGLARALVVELLRGAHERGADWSWLLAELPAAGVYLGVGFQDVAEWWLWSRP